MSQPWLAGVILVQVRQNRVIDKINGRID